MIILTLRTDKPESEIGLYDNETQLAYEVWPAHRQLAETLHIKIGDLLDSVDKNLHEINGIVVYQGPGSFTGLRIGIATANALAYGIGCPVVGAASTDWLETGIKRLLAGENDTVALPEYGASVHITQQKK